MSDDFPRNIVSTLPFIADQQKRKAGQSTLRLDTMEKEHIEKVLKFAEGNKSKAARLLGISRKKLYQKIEEDS